MGDRRVLGRFGEEVVAAHLEQQGYELVARGWRCGVGEIDLVVRKEGQLVFVEVRTRRGNERGTPEESVGVVKRRRLIALAHTYLDQHGIDGDWRIDVVAVVVDRRGRVERLTHLEYAVEA